MNEIAGMLVSALGQGFIYAPMALGVFLTFSILKTPDLTVEGSFVFGMTSPDRESPLPISPAG